METTTNGALVRVEKVEKTRGFDIEEVEEQRRSSGRRRSSGVSVASSRLSSSSSSTPGTPSRLSIRAVADRYKRVSVVRRLSIAESRRTKDALASDDGIDRSREDINLLVATWNLGNKCPRPEELREWLPHEGGFYDLIVVGTQENAFSDPRPKKDKPGKAAAASPPAAAPASAGEQAFLFAVGARVKHGERGLGTVAELMPDGRTRIIFDEGSAHRYKRSSLHKLELVALPPQDESDDEASSSKSSRADWVPPPPATAATAATRHRHHTPPPPPPPPPPSPAPPLPLPRSRCATDRRTWPLTCGTPCAPSGSAARGSCWRTSSCARCA